MINKSKGNNGVKVNTSNTNSRRPKRCHLCKKSFPVDKYDQHFQNCYRFQNNKIQQNRQHQHRTLPKNTSQMINQNNKVATSKSKNINNPQRPSSTNRFRIKNMSNPSTISNKPTANRLSKKQEKKSIKKSIITQEIEKKPEKKQQEKRQREIQQNQERMFQRTISMDSSREEEMTFFRGQEISRQPIRSEPRVQEYHQRGNRNQLSTIQPRRQNQNTSNNSFISFLSAQQQQQQPPPPPPSPPPPPPPPQVENPPQQPVNSQQNTNPTLMQVIQPSAPNQQAPYDIQSMISNSNSIIEFIRNNEVMMQDETLVLMMAQLQQLNMIAEQIAQLNQIGRSLAFRVGNVFAIRIHELQSAIINQIGIALIRGFHGNLNFQFLNLAQMQPSLKVGFTEAEIDNLFQEKINMEEKECSICLQDMKKFDMVLQLQCNHLFHPSCIREWLLSSKKCPMCRSEQVELPIS